MNLRDLRQHKKLTRTQLAVALDTNESTIARWERGTVAPSVRRIRPLALALDVGVGTVVEAVEETHLSASSQRGPTTKSGEGEARVSGGVGVDNCSRIG